MSPDSGFLEQKVSRFPSYTVQNASENDRKTDKACEAGSWLSLPGLPIKCVIIGTFFLTRILQDMVVTRTYSIKLFNS